MITNIEVESIIKKFPKTKSEGTDGFSVEFYPIFKKELISILLKQFPKI